MAEQTMWKKVEEQVELGDTGDIGDEKPKGSQENG